jgi:hypothetical protein
MNFIEFLTTKYGINGGELYNKEGVKVGELDLDGSLGTLKPTTRDIAMALEGDYDSIASYVLESGQFEPGKVVDDGQLVGTYTQPGIFKLSGIPDGDLFEFESSYGRGTPSFGTERDLSNMGHTAPKQYQSRRSFDRLR